jgi:hypothetical protein
VTLLQAEKQTRGNEEVVFSAPPTHLMLLLLDEMKGKPQTTKELTEKLSKQLASGNGLVTKYIDIDELVEDDLEYLQHLRLAERVATGNGGSVRITTLGSLMALSLRPSADG